MQMARDKGLDLMEVSPTQILLSVKFVITANLNTKKEKNIYARKNRPSLGKEVQLRPQTDVHDLDYKFRNVRAFEDGDKAKIVMMSRPGGRVRGCWF